MRGTPAIYFKSLNRHFNVMGVDRQLFYLFVAICVPIAFSARLVPLMDGISIAIFMMFYIIGVLMTRADNQMLAVYRRHIHYKKYYTAVPGLHAKSAMVKLSVPIYQGKRGLV